MAKFLTFLDLNQNELRNVALQSLAAAPSTPVPGQAYYDSVLDTARLWNGTVWLDMANQSGGDHADADHADTFVALADHDTALHDALNIDAATLDGNAPAAFVLVADHNTALHDALGIDAATLDGNAATAFVQASTVGVANGVAGLDANGTVPASQLSQLAIVNVHPVANIAARDGLTAQAGDLAIVADTGSGEPGTYVYDDDNAQWLELESPTDGVTSVVGGNGITSTGGATPTIAIDTAVVRTRVAADVGDGAATEYTVNHGLGTRDVAVEVYESATPWASVVVDVERPSTDTVRSRFATAPAVDEFRVVIG